MRARPAVSTVNFAATTNATPTGLTAPSGVIVAAGLLLGRGPDGLYDVSFDFYFTDSAADSVSVVATVYVAATAVSNGTIVGGWHIENGGTPISVDGTPIVLETLTKTVPAGGLSAAISARFFQTLVAHSKFAIAISVTSAHDLSSMVFNGVINELGL